MVDLNFNITNHHLQINLSTLPEGCRAVILYLPDGNHLLHQFNNNSPDQATFQLEQLPALSQEFVEYLEFQEDLKETTLTGYRKRLRQFVDWLQRHPKDHPAKSSTWIKYFATLKQRGLASHTRKGHYHILNRFGARLTKQGYFFTHPLTEVKPPEVPRQREPKAIFREHIRAMLGAVDNPRDRAILLFFRDTGCRATEALSLTWGDIRLDEGKVVVPGKGDKERPLFLKPVTRQALKVYRESVAHKKSDPVWVSKKGPMSYDGLYKVFKRLAEKVDIGDENFNPHAWRHAFGRDTTQAGIPTAQLQDLLGHSSIEVTKIYAQFTNGELQEAHDRYSPVDKDITSDINNRSEGNKGDPDNANS